MENRLKTLGIISDCDREIAKSEKASSLLKDINLEIMVPLKKVDFLTWIMFCTSKKEKKRKLYFLTCFLILIYFCVDEGDNLVYAS